MTRRYPLRLPSALCLAAICLIGGLSGSALAAGDAKARDTKESNRVVLAPAQIEALGLRLAKAVPATDYLIAAVPGVIAPPPNARVAVAATFPGTVLQTFVQEGEKVRRGQALAVIASRDILNQGAEAAHARAQLAVAEAAAARMTRLGAEGIVAGARVDEAQAEYLRAKAEAAALSRILEDAGADTVKGTYTLRAPIDGVVAVARIEAGRPVESMNAPFVVDAVGRFEVEAQVPERLVGRIAPGMTVRIGTVGGGGADAVRAEVTSVGTVIQPETRSVTLKAAIAPAPGAPIVAGRTATVTVHAAAPAGAVEIPGAAVVDVAGAPSAFVQDKGGFVIRSVTTAGAAGATVVVTSGVAAGEQVAITGLSELKSMALSN